MRLSNWLRMANCNKRECAVAHVITWPNLAQNSPYLPCLSQDIESYRLSGNVCLIGDSRAIAKRNTSATDEEARH